ncbi:hypothetical protein [Ferrimonas sp. YFM]|uniref:hypothetical protein n=1 Tax=Ferrimonas sp. YFM TaxID=3028878 RepID=UPI0025737CD4|nr:hypothetical protein [Ferrimonas sp. YFM]BDY05429.1 hypothetical protein F0521_24700 [Ferrimonas sp. YFM]
MKKCKLCNIQSDLQISHAVGDSVFKKIFRTNSGKAIAITSGNAPIGYSSDSWAENQLCADCEKLLNHNYERYSLGVLRGSGCTFEKKTDGLHFSNLDQHKLIMYFLSIYWRAANSSHASYRNVVILDKDNEYLRNAILNDLSIPSNKFSIKLSRVLDLSKSKGFTDQAIKQFIVSPFCRIYENEKVENISVCFMFEGFFIEVYLKGLDEEEQTLCGLLSETKSDLVIPYLNLFDIDEIVDLMVDGYRKHLEGNSRVKANKK